jgi:hypothetical protein
MLYRRRWVAVSLIGLLALGLPTSAAAQEQAIEPAFSDRVLATFGLPEIAIVQTADGFEAPREVAAGPYLVSLTSAPGSNAYLDLVRVPAGLSAAEAGQQLLSAARNDTPVAGWTYGGGTYAVDGGTAWVILDLEPGEWAWGLTAAGSGQGAEETPYLEPLTVTAGGTPAASPIAAEPGPVVEVRLTEFAFDGLAGATLPAGPAVWRFTNAGDQPHHMVLYRTPKLVTPEDVRALVEAFMGATPTPPPGWWTEAVWVGYAAILSPGRSIVTEYALAPGSYLALCFITDPTTGAPHVAEGMAQSFTVR